jgi:hypothetical protein
MSWRAGSQLCKLFNADTSEVKECNGHVSVMVSPVLRTARGFSPQAVQLIVSREAGT